MEEPILLWCKFCLCYTIIYEHNFHTMKMYFTPNFCGQCGAKNPDSVKVDQMEPDLDCEYCGQELPNSCFHEDVQETLSPGPHFHHPRCIWLLEKAKCPRSLRGTCPECGAEVKGERSKDNLYTYWKCHSCGWGDTQSQNRVNIVSKRRGRSGR